MPRLLIAMALVLGSGCAHPTAETPGPVDHNIITKDDLTKSHYSTLYEAVEGMRRAWLRSRGNDSFSTPNQVKVYLDNVMLGGPETLRNIIPSSVSYLQFFDGIAATTRWGTDHGAGVIYVSTRPAPARPD